jgi:palmitoyltransferase
MGNYQWFYSFLVANIVVMTYALYIVGCVLKRDWTGLNNIAEVKAEAALSFLLASFDCIVIWFTYMQYSLLRDGMTTNELSKWNIVHDLVQSGTLFELSGIYFEYLEHEDVFVSVNQTDNRVRNVTKDMLTQVGSIEQLTNIYDKGNLWDNVKERLDTKPLL